MENLKESSPQIHQTIRIAHSSPCSLQRATQFEGDSSSSDRKRRRKLIKKWERERKRKKRETNETEESKGSSQIRVVKEKKKAKRKKHSKKPKRDHPSDFESDSQDSIRQSLPKIPRNPLEAAYDIRHYDRGPRRFLKDWRHEKSWEHDLYLNRSPSPCRERTEGEMWDTRKGSWKSRAGGVYLPADNSEMGPTKVAKYKNPLAPPPIIPSRHPSDLSDSTSPERGVYRRDSPVYELD